MAFFKFIYSEIYEMGSELSTVSAADMYAFIRTPETAIQTLGKSMALSNLFGCANVQQGEMLAWECIARRMPPFRLKQKYHLFFNQLTQRADDMLAEFHGLGGRSRIVERTPDKVAVLLTYGADSQTFALAWSDCLNEPFIYQTTKDCKESDVLDAIDAGKHSKLKLKAKYRSPRSRMQMLWARVISDGIRAMAPEVNNGAYTPEEIDGSDDGGEVIEADYTVTAESESAEVAAAATTVVDQTPANSTPIVPRCSAMARQSIAEMLTQLGVADSQAQDDLISQRYSVTAAGLNESQATELLGILRAKVLRQIEAEKAEAGTKAAIDALRNTMADHGITTAEGHDKFASELFGCAMDDLSEPQAIEAATKFKLAAEQLIAREVERAKHTTPGASPENEGPCSEVQIAEAKRLLAELEQSKPGSVERFITALKAAGFAKVADLSVCECDELIRHLGVKNLEAFIESTLTKRDIPFDTEG
jgi:hypothetical protein